MIGRRNLLLLVPLCFALLSVMALLTVASAQDRLDSQAPLPNYQGQVLLGRPQSSDDRQITGVLTGMWEDFFDGTGASIIHFTLNEKGGGRYELVLDGMPSTAPQQLWRLNGEQVTISGQVIGNELVANRKPQLYVSAVYANLPHGDRVHRNIVGNIPYISVLCSFPDADTSFKPASYFQRMYDDEYPMVGHFWEELSYGKVSLAGSGVAGPYPMPHPRPYYEDYGSIADDCLALADPEVDFSAYYGINLMLDMDYNNWSATGGFWYGTLDGVEKWFPMTRLPPAWGWGDLYVVEHEMGHSFGLSHSTNQYGGDYGSPWDVMSDYSCEDHHPSYGCLGQHTIAYHKQKLGWLQPSDIYTVTDGVASGIVLQRSALPTDDGYLAINVPLFGEHGPYFTIEARERVGHDIGLPGEGVIIHEVSPFGPPHRYVGAEVIDVDGNGDTSDSGAIWTVGESFVHPNGMTVTVRSKSQGSYVIDVELAPVSFTTCNDQELLSTSECMALTELYEATNGESWKRDTSWMDITEPCYWYGVECWFNPSQAADSPLLAVGALYLYDNGLNGTLPPGLGGLKDLAYLYLHDNQITGPIPPEIGKLESISALYLQNNQLVGPLPNELADLKNLGLLYLHNNQLVGGLPQGIGALEELEGIIVNDNLFSGPLPQTFKNLRLDTFYFYNTQLCEPPDDLFQSWLSNIYSVLSSGITCTTSLYAPFYNGSPGSQFDVSGILFYPYSQVDVEINGSPLGKVETDSNGDLEFILSTTGADEGKYKLVASSNSKVAEYTIMLIEDAPKRVSQGDGPVLDVPPGISLNDIFLPVLSSR